MSKSLTKYDYWLCLLILVTCSTVYFLISYFVTSETLKFSLLGTGSVTFFEIYLILRIFLLLPDINRIEKSILVVFRCLFVCFFALLIQNINYSPGSVIGISGLFMVGIWWVGVFHGIYLPRGYEKYLDEEGINIGKGLQIFLVLLIFISRISFTVLVLGFGYLLFNKLSPVLATTIFSVFILGYILFNYLKKFFQFPSSELKQDTAK